MLLFKTKVGPSIIPDAGLGLFAGEPIPKGSVVWEFTQGFDLRVDEGYVENLPGVAKEFFFTFAAQDPKTKEYTLCLDNARYYNHSENPTVACVGSEKESNSKDIAIRDIQPGEELTIDYRLFDTDPEYGFIK